MTTIRIVLGDLPTQEVDAVVNAADLLAFRHARSLAVADEVVRHATTAVEEVRFVLRDQWAYEVFAAEPERVIPSAP